MPSNRNIWAVYHSTTGELDHFSWASVRSPSELDNNLDASTYAALTDTDSSMDAAVTAWKSVPEAIRIIGNNGLKVSGRFIIGNGIRVNMDDSRGEVMLADQQSLKDKLVALRNSYIAERTNDYINRGVDPDTAGALAKANTEHLAVNVDGITITSE